MRTIYVNELYHGDKEVVRGFVVVPKTIEEDIPIIFGKDGSRIVEHWKNHERTVKERGFYTILRFCQFVILFKYDKTIVALGNTRKEMGISIEVLYFGTSPNINDAFDYMLLLRKTGWTDIDRDKILELNYQIRKDMAKSHFEIAEIKKKDSPDILSSFL